MIEIIEIIEMRVLVTGGSGLVGKSLNSYIKNENEFQIKDCHFTFVSSKDADLRIKEEVDKLFIDREYDAIIHLAACVGGLYKNMDSNVEMYLDNMAINTNIIKACHQNNINRGIFCLSSCVFPEKPNSFPMTEEDLHRGKPHFSNYGYAHSKRQLEVMCDLYSSSYNRQYICVSPVNLYGPFDNFSIKNGHVLPSVMHRMYNNSLNSEDFMVYGTGRAFRQFLYAPDFAKAIVKLLLDIRVKFGIFNVCDMSSFEGDISIPEYSIQEVVYMIAKNLNFPKEKIKNDILKSDGIYKKTVSAVVFKVRYPDFKFTPLSEGLEITVKWMIDNFDSIRK